MLHALEAVYLAPHLVQELQEGILQPAD
jgi:hypothetical protein